MRKGALWISAFVVTVALAVWQRTTGPTYPLRGSVVVDGTRVRLVLVRSGETGTPLAVTVTAPDEVRGELAWRRFPTDEPWRRQPLERAGERLGASIPSQPPAGKVEYQLRLAGNDGREVVFPEQPAVARFKAPVPTAILLPHVLAMFLAMAFAVRTAFAALGNESGVRHFAWTTFVLLGVGGFVLGPAVQKYAFGAWWTGVPFGWDLTDNKTLLAGLAWAWALWRLHRRGSARGSVVAAALVMLLVFSIPHSVWGSELDWRTVPAEEPAAVAP